jgi:aminoglycoside phosphotransferase (APT) family kinase protein
MTRPSDRGLKKRKIGQLGPLQATETKSDDQPSAKRRKVRQHPQPHHAQNKSKAEQHPLSKLSERPSDSWLSFDESYGSVQARKIKNIILTGDWTYLCSEAVKHYESAQALTCTIDHTRFARGMGNVVFEVAFSNSTYWIVRIRLSDEQEAETEMLSEIATTRLVQQMTSIPVPTIFAYNCGKGNPFGFRYMLMSALPGRVLDDPFSMSVPAHHKNKVASQLAKYLHELSRITFDKIGRIWCGNHVDENPRIISFQAHGECNGRHALCRVGPFKTSRSYFRALRQGLNKAVRVEHSDGEDWPEWSKACRVLTDAIPYLIIGKYQRGPFLLYHRDFHYNNILLDNDFNITGILDWSAAQTVPVEQFLVSPEFIPLPGLSEEGNRPIIEFRAMFIRAWMEIEKGTLSKSLLAISDVASWTIPELVYRCISSVLWHSRLAVMFAERVQRLLYSHVNSDAEHTPSASNSPHTRIDGQVFRLIICQASRRSNRNPSEKPRAVASESLGPFRPSKVSKADRNPPFGPQQRPTVPEKADVNIAEPQIPPVPANLRKRLRIPPFPSVAKDTIRTTRSKSKQNIAGNMATRSSAKPQGISKRQGAKTTRGRGMARKE